MVYQNAAGCNDVIAMTAVPMYTNDLLFGLKVRGGYSGTVVQGSPRVDWETNIVYTYDDDARLAKEELAVTAMTKTYMDKPYGFERQEISQLYPEMRVRKPIEKIRHCVQSLHEENPMLGLRGCRLDILYPEITAIQARAIF